MDTNTIQVIDDNGNEIDFTILFTFDSDDTKKSYVLYYNAEDEQPQVYSSIYDDEGNLYPVETPEEWEMIEEVFNSFIAQDDEDEEDEDEHECCCNGDDDCCCEEDEHECCCHKNEG